MDASKFLDIFDRRAKRREERREFFKLAGGFAAGAAGTLALTACGGHSPAAVAQTASAPSDADILNFALNLEYLEANFYSYAVTGNPISASLMTGTGTQGTVTAGQAATFSTTLVKNYAAEIVKDEVNHVAFLRSALGASAVAMPSIDVSPAVFNTAAQAANTAMPFLPAGATFNPYANDESFLLGAYIFEDVGVTAYHGAASLISSKTYLDAAAGILAVEAYHAGLIRTALYAMGLQTPAPAVNPFTATASISNLRATLDGSVSTGMTDDFGIGSATTSTIVPANANSLAFDRSTAQVLNIVYGTTATTTMGLFFPNGMNGNIRMSG